MNRRGGRGFDGGRGGRGFGPGRGGRGPHMGGGRSEGMGRGMSHYGPAGQMTGGGGRGGPMHNNMMNDRGPGRGMMGRGPPMGPGRGMNGRGDGRDHYGPMHGNGRGGPMHPMNGRGPGPMHPMNGMGPGPMHPMNGRGGPMHRATDRGPPMMGRGPGNDRGPPPPPPPHHPRQMMGNQMNPNPMYNQQGGPPPPPPPPRPQMGFNNGPMPPQHNMQQMNHPNNNMNPQMQMQQQGPPGPPMGGPPNQFQPNQQQFQPGRPNNNMMRLPPNQQHQQQQLPPYGQGQQGQGYPPQQQHTQQMNQQQQQPQPMAPQQFQQPSPMQQHNMQQPPPRMGGPPPQQYPPNQQPSPQSMQRPPMQQQQQQQQPMQQPPQSQPGVQAATVVTPGTVKNADAAWTEHKSPAGAPYFYNTVTGVSTYERPVALGGTATPAPSTTPTAAAKTTTGPSSASPASKSKKWSTYTDEYTGKKYYSDGVTTTWSRPAELGPEEDDRSKQKRGVSFQQEGETPRKKKKTSSNNSSSESNKKDDSISLYASKAEAIAAFKGLLLAKDIAPTTKWNDVVRICSEDVRWEACSTIGERKQALAEYQTKRANELRDVKRQEKVRAKEAYQRLLTDILPTSTKFTPGSSRFMDVRDSLSKDDRFYAVEDETTREELFYEWVEELRKKEERSKRNKKREAKEGCVKFLKSREEEDKLTFASTWSSFLSSLSDTEKSDLRFATSPHMSESDRQLYFSDYVIELQNAEDEKRRRIRDAQRRAEKAQRDAFREKLSELAKNGVITPETRWRGIEEKVSTDYPAVFEPVQAQGREVARELFEDFVFDWKEEYRRDKATLVRVWDSSAKKKEFKFDDDKVTAEEFGKVLLESSAGSPDLYGEIRRISNRENPVSGIQLYFNELRADAETAKNGQKKKRGSLADGAESSEDEGEIIEDGEVDEKEES